MKRKDAKDLMKVAPEVELADALKAKSTSIKVKNPPSITPAVEFLIDFVFVLDRTTWRKMCSSSWRGKTSWI